MVFGEGENVLNNPSFEGPPGSSTLQEKGWRSSLSSWMPNGWQPWFRRGGLNPSIGREPEFAIKFRPSQAHDGGWHVAWFNSYGTHDGGIFQRVLAPKGATATFTLWMWGWSNKDDVWGRSQAVYHKWVGIDPFGGTNPDSPTVKWFGPEDTMDKWVRMEISAVVEGDAVTVFARGKPDFPMKNNAVIADDASLVFSTARPPISSTPAADAPGIDGDSITFKETGKSVKGYWLQWYDEHGGVDVFGNPLTEVIKDPITGWHSQYFQKAVLDWRIGEDGTPWIERRLLGDLLYPVSDPPLTEDQAPSSMAEYYPYTSPTIPTGLGHFVSDVTKEGQVTYFREFFLRYGGVQSFGYPKEEPKVRDGRWTQRFQAGTLIAYPEYDMEGIDPITERPFAELVVGFDNLGEKYIAAKKLVFK
jgi:hypothetical protein